MLDLGLSLPSSAGRRRHGSGAAPAPVAALTAIAADGWSATYPSPPPQFTPETAPETVMLSRQGFDAAGQPVTVAEPLTITARVRQPFPNQGQLTADRVALSDYVYATDAIAGAANLSAETSPKPVANWIMPHRLVVANTIRIELIAGHRNARQGRQVACVRFIANDGAKTVSQVVASTIVSGRAGDKNAVVCFQCDLDVSGLADNALITVNAEVYPWIGGAASIARSVDNAALREFSPRYFLKNGALASAPPLAYVNAATGSNASGVVSTNAATAAASPFLDIDAAINAIHSAHGATSGVDGAIIRVNGTRPLQSTAITATQLQKVACITIERDPAVPRGQAVVTFGTTAFRPRLGGALAPPLATGALRFRDISIQRTGTAGFTGEASAPLGLVFEDVDYDGGGFNAAWLSNADDSWFGANVVNAGTGSGFNASAREHRCFRGVSIDLNGNAMEGWLVVGCDVTRPGALANGGRSESGAIRAFNRFVNPSSGSVLSNPGASADVSGFALVQNVFEYYLATTQSVTRVSGDNATGNNSHVIYHNNSFAGAFQAGRSNLFYDEGATPRTSKLMSMKGNIHVAVYTKSDVFVGTNNNGSPDPGGAAARTGNWAFKHGVGCAGEFHQFMANDGGGQGSEQAQDFPGLGVKKGTSQSIRNDPLFASYQATTYNGATFTAGAGGGNYSLQPGSPARALLPEALLSHDLGGTPRPPADDSAGAYA